MTGASTPVRWGEHFQWREKVHQRYPDLWDLKIVRKRLPFVLKYLKDGDGVLEIGWFDRSLEGIPFIHLYQMPGQIWPGFREPFIFLPLDDRMDIFKILLILLQPYGSK